MTAPAPLEATSMEALKARKSGEFAYENVQYSIEQLYDLRSQVLRIAFLGTLLHRPDPDRATPEAEQQQALADLERYVTQFDRVVGMLETARPSEGVHPLVAGWMQQVAQASPERMAILRQVNGLNQRILKAAQCASADQSLSLREHRRVAAPHIHDAITDLCLSMWQAYDKNQTLRLARAQSAAETLGERLSRLERIGTHVRLVSLNATVEAARIGPEGRGLSLIAQEFKGLAEEVRSLAQQARKDVDTMLADS